MTVGSSLTGARLREIFLSFFAARGHVLLPSASLVPEHDPTVLFTTAGMQPLVPFLLGQPHPQGKRLVSVQKCLRTSDIEAVGDATHLTFFEMLGNWSLGDYFKDEAIVWSHEFLTSDRCLGIPLDKLAVTVFAGDADAPRDEAAARVWRQCGMPQERVFFFGKEENWWGPAGKTGPCGPDTEMFYDTGHPSCGRRTCGPNCPCGKWVEIWNDVFMEYEKMADGSVRALAQKNVDTGMGLERTVAVLHGLQSVFETDLFTPLLKEIQRASPRFELRAARIVADHMRAAVFAVADGVLPSNVDRGYVVRRLVRRAIRFSRILALPEPALGRLADTVVNVYGGNYPELKARQAIIQETVQQEHHKFGRTLERGLKEFRRIADSAGERRRITGHDAFSLASSYGFPFELTEELAHERGLLVHEEEYRREQTRHQELSRAGSDKKFAGGLADHAEETTKLHTATHLLHAALRKVLGTHVEQRGSNITARRLRFDFAHSTKLTPEELRAIEDLVNEHIRLDLPVTRELMTPAEAKQRGALGFFERTYGERVSVYAVGDVSQEICGGPHVARTGMLGRFTIVKEEAVSAGIRRIRAVVGDA